MSTRDLNNFYTQRYEFVIDDEILLKLFLFDAPCHKNFIAPWGRIKTM